MIKINLVIFAVALIFLFIVPEACDYLYGYFLFRNIGKNLTVNIVDDVDKAANVALWVFDNIKMLESRQRYLFSSTIDDNFLNIYKRGFGTCDQSAHVYATIMHYLGFESKLLMLVAEDSAFKHTVAVIKIGNNSMIVDTAFKFIFVDDKKNLIGINELENSKVFDEYVKVIKDTAVLCKTEFPVEEVRPSWFSSGKYFETFPYEGRRATVKRLMRKIISKNKSTQNVRNMRKD